MRAMSFNRVVIIFGVLILCWMIVSDLRASNLLTPPSSSSQVTLVPFSPPQIAVERDVVVARTRPPLPPPPPPRRPFDCNIDDCFDSRCAFSSKTSGGGCALSGLGFRGSNDVPASSPSSRSQSTTTTDPFSWLFGPSQIPGRCDKSSSSSSSSSSNSMRGAHVRDALYKLDNFCLRPTGAIAGFNPRHVDPYHGVSESFGINDFEHEVGMKNFLANVEPLHKEPACFIGSAEERVVLFPITKNSDNVGHALHRAGGMLRFLETAFGEKVRDQRENVTIVYVITDAASPDLIAALDPSKNNNNNELLLHSGILGTSRFVVMTARAAEHAKQRWKNPERDLPSLESTAMKCFRTGFVWQNAHAQIARREKELNSQTPATKTSFSLFGNRVPRDAETVDLLNSALRRRWFSSSPRRSAPNRANPVVVFCIRSRSRRFTLQPLLISMMSIFVREQLNGTLRVVENSELKTVPDVLAAHSDADILIGMLGAGLIWTEMMPPGAVLVEFNNRDYRCAVVSGVGKNTDCDFGGAAASARQLHVAIANYYEPAIRFPHGRVIAAAAASGAAVGGRAAIRLEAQARNAIGGFDLAVGWKTMKFAIEKAKCLLLLEPRSDCQFAQSDVDAVIKSDAEDDDGEFFASCFKVQPAAASSSSHNNNNDNELHLRLLSLIRSSALVSTLTRSLRLRSALSGRSISNSVTEDSLEVVSILIVLQCLLVDPQSADTSLPENALAARFLMREVGGWRSAIQYAHRVTVIDGATPLGGGGEAKQCVVAESAGGESSSAEKSKRRDEFFSSPAHMPSVLLCRYPCRGMEGQADLIVLSSGGGATVAAEDYVEQRASVDGLKKRWVKDATILLSVAVDGSGVVAQ